jgi:hypothetical protein
LPMPLDVERWLSSGPSSVAIDQPAREGALVGFRRIDVP